MRGWKRAAAIGVLATGLGSGNATTVNRDPHTAARLLKIDSRRATPADWITTDGARVVFGSGTDLVVALSGPTLTVQARRTLARTITDAVLLGRYLAIVQEDTFLGLLDLQSSDTMVRPVRLDPPPRGALRIDRMRGGLLVAEEGLGLRFLASVPGGHDPGSHSVAMGHAPTFRPSGFLPLDRPVTSLAGAIDRAYVVFDRRTIAEVRVDASGPRIVRERSLQMDIGALAAAQTRLYVVGTSGARVLSRPEMTPESAAGENPEIVGRSMARAGRVLYVAAGEDGVTTARETGAGPQLHQVSVENDFFSPRVLEIDVGDTVQWTNASGLHNVFSCVPEQLGCDTSSNETFVSGEPADPIWIYSHTFELPGSNPYICQSHAPFMTGLVQVAGAPPVPSLSGWRSVVLLVLILTGTMAFLFRRRESD